MSADVIKQFFEKVLSSEVTISNSADKISALNVSEGVDGGEPAKAFIKKCLRDEAADVRYAALKTIRLIGWQHPDLFKEVWSLLESQPGQDEQLTAIIALGAEDSPPPEKWRALLESKDLLIVRQSLRSLKQFSDNQGRLR